MKPDTDAAHGWRVAKVQMEIDSLNERILQLIAKRSDAERRLDELQRKEAE